MSFYVFCGGRVFVFCVCVVTVFQHVGAFVFVWCCVDVFCFLFLV